MDSATKPPLLLVAQEEKDDHRSPGSSIVVGLSIASAWSNDVGPTLIRECPSCKTRILQPTMATSNTFGARHWTDGKMLAPYKPFQPPIVKCPKCNVLFWINKTKELGHAEVSAARKEWPDAVNPLTASSEEILNFVKKGGFPEEEEFEVRMLSWWTSNDKVRMDTDARYTISKAQKKNLEVLMTMLDENNASERIMKAEMLRELGRFEESKALLSYTFSGRLEEVATFIKNLADEKNDKVREIKKNERITIAGMGPHFYS